ncbi:MAG TPA: ferredoxin--nitrite reductase, partial [Lachnospiraceae bacterium]|nr:ferredoxin--nitrite reductase [Lachnospiraceae bacterium]
THGNYTQRAKARTRYMQDTLGEKEFLTAFHSALQEALHSGENLTLIPEPISFTKHGDGT